MPRSSPAVLTAGSPPQDGWPFAGLLDLAALTLATCGTDGDPHAAAVYFAIGKALRFYFFSDRASQHAADLSANPRAAVEIHPETRGWREIHGLQMRGQAVSVPPGAEWDEAWQVYSAKFPFVSAFRPVVARSRLYVFVPHWARLSDNRRGFGFKKEWIIR